MAARTHSCADQMLRAKFRRTHRTWSAREVDTRLTLRDLAELKCARTLDELPKCWFMRFPTIGCGRRIRSLTSVQSIVLQLHVRLIDFQDVHCWMLASASAAASAFYASDVPTWCTMRSWSTHAIRISINLDTAKADGPYMIYHVSLGADRYSRSFRWLDTFELRLDEWVSTVSIHFDFGRQANDRGIITFKLVTVVSNSQWPVYSP
jgi:hypothetical protein